MWKCGRLHGLKLLLPNQFVRAKELVVILNIPVNFGRTLGVSVLLILLLANVGGALNLVILAVYRLVVGGQDVLLIGRVVELKVWIVKLRMGHLIVARIVILIPLLLLHLQAFLLPQTEVVGVLMLVVTLVSVIVGSMILVVGQGGLVV